MTAVRWKKTLISADDFGIRVSVSLSGSRHGEVSEFYLQLRHCWELRRIRLYFWTQQLFSSTVSAVSREATHSAHRTGHCATPTRAAHVRAEVAIVRSLSHKGTGAIVYPTIAGAAAHQSSISPGSGGSAPPARSH